MYNNFILRDATILYSSVGLYVGGRCLSVCTSIALYQNGIDSAGLTMWQMWQMPRSSGIRGGPPGVEQIFQPVSSQVI